MCFGCRKPAVFSEAGGYLYLRRPNPTEQAELDADPVFQKALAAYAEGDTLREARQNLQRQLLDGGLTRRTDV